MDNTASHPAAIRQEIDREGDETITDLSFLNAYSASQLESTTTLNLNSTPFKSLEGIERLPNLQVLDLGGTEISDLSRLSLLSQLRILRLTNAPIENIDALADLNELRELYIDNNSNDGMIVDIQAVSRFLKLENLSVAGNSGITTLTPVASLPSLKVLDISHTEVSTLTPIASLASLEELYLYGSRSASGLSPLFALSKLKVLAVDSDIKHTANAILGTIREAREGVSRSGSF